MGIDEKYGRVTFESGSIGEDEPVMVFRAQGALLPEVISFYAQRCREEGSPDRHLEWLRRAFDTVQAWQEGHPTKTPDTDLQANPDLARRIEDTATVASVTVEQDIDRPRWMVDVEEKAEHYAARWGVAPIEVKEALHDIFSILVLYGLGPYQETHCEKQIDKLAKVLMEEFGGPTRDEGAVDMAIRLLRSRD